MLLLHSCCLLFTVRVSWNAALSSGKPRGTRTLAVSAACLFNGPASYAEHTVVLHSVSSRNLFASSGTSCCSIMHQHVFKVMEMAFKEILTSKKQTEKACVLWAPLRSLSLDIILTRGTSGSLNSQSNADLCTALL